MLVKVIKIVYPAIKRKNIDFYYCCIENTQAMFLVANTRPIRKRLTQNLVKRFKKEQPLSSYRTWDINNKTIGEGLLGSAYWIKDVEEVLSYEI